jgi:hypothetical protein
VEKFSRYTHEREYKPIIEQSIKFLQSYTPRIGIRIRTRNFLFRNTQETDEKIEYIGLLIEKLVNKEREFVKYVMARKRYFEIKLYRNENKREYESVNPFMIIEFLNEVDSRREDITGYISSLQSEIGCTANQSMSFYNNKLKRKKKAGRKKY